MISSSFGLLNTTILILYLFGMLIIGWIFSRHKQNAEQFFLGGRNLPWLAVAMSMYASLTSAVTYIGLPATAYQENIALIAVSFASLAVAPIILKLFTPSIIGIKSQPLINLSKNALALMPNEALPPSLSSADSAG